MGVGEEREKKNVCLERKLIFSITSNWGNTTNVDHYYHFIVFWFLRSRTHGAYP